MRLLLTLREINWLSVVALITSIAAPLLTAFTAPEYLGLTLAGSAIALAVLAGADRN